MRPAVDVAALMAALDGLPRAAVAGTVRRVVGMEVLAAGLRARVGDLVSVAGDTGPLPAQVVAITDAGLLLAPLGTVEGISAGARVEASGTGLRLRVGPDLLGRVLDALGAPIDAGPPLTGQVVDHAHPVPHPLERSRIDTALPLGVRAIDTMLTCGVGQRVGIMAGSGVGKSTLLGMMARGTQADVVVIALIGERGREVREFLEDDLGPAGQARAVTVVATSDAPPLLRIKAAYTATRIAEHFRDEGANVLLLFDSLSRFAMAAREVGLAAGELPANRGYPPSVFAELPRLLERTGPAATGSITAMYTVLADGDDMNDPIVDATRSILDGHIVLSRRLAAAGHYPTIDVLASASRLAGKVTTPEQRHAVIDVRRAMAALEESRELVEIGAYRPGTNPELDAALTRKGAINDFLRQDVGDVVDAATAWDELGRVLR